MQKNTRRSDEDFFCGNFLKDVSKISRFFRRRIFRTKLSAFNSDKIFFVYTALRYATIEKFDSSCWFQPAEFLNQKPEMCLGFFVSLRSETGGLKQYSPGWFQFLFFVAQLFLELNCFETPVLLMLKQIEK